MAVPALCMLVILAMAGYSSAAYCVCNSGVSDSTLQKNIDYACGNGADCTQILQNGPCYNPNTVKDHCNYAVNSYFQKKGEAQGSCDFSGTATVSQTPPSGANSVCYPGSPSSGTPTNPSISPPAGTGTPGTGTGTGTPPGMGTGTGTPPGTGTGTGMGTGTGTGTGTGVTNPSFGGLGPSGTTGINDNSAVSFHQSANFFYSFPVLALFVSGLVWLRLV